MKIENIVIAVFASGLLFWVLLHDPWTPRLTANVGEVSVSNQVAYNSCNLDNVVPELIATGETDTTVWHGRFDLPDSPFIWETAEPDEVVSQFREELRERLGEDIDSRSLIERQRAIFMKLPYEWSGEAFNSTLLLDSRAGIITNMSCLELMLWNWQNARYPMLEHPTEFGAFVLRGHGKVRVYLSSADLVGGKMNSEVTERMNADIKSGYRLFTHIHNHPFLFGREVGDRMWTTEATIEDIAGALAPSMSDVSVYRGFRDSHGLEQAWITNGLQTSRFHDKEFDILAAR